MSANSKILPGTGRWRAEGVTEGPFSARIFFAAASDPSTTSWSPSPFRRGIL